MPIVVVVAVAVIALAAAWSIQQRRTPDAPTQSAWQVPSQLDRHDFARPDAPWLVAVFSSATCGTCAKVVAQCAVLDTREVAVDNVEYSARTDIHKRYSIDAVPIVVIADAAGVVQASFVGPMTATDLWAAMAEVREPGSTPDNPDCEGKSRPQSGAEPHQH